MPKLSKKKLAELQTQFDMYSRAIESSQIQINKLIGEQDFNAAVKERERRRKLETEQRQIGAQL